MQGTEYHPCGRATGRENGYNEGKGVPWYASSKGRLIQGKCTQFTTYATRENNRMKHDKATECQSTYIMGRVNDEKIDLSFAHVSIDHND